MMSSSTHLAECIRFFAGFLRVFCRFFSMFLLVFESFCDYLGIFRDGVI
jgi:hypothetical protein